MLSIVNKYLFTWPKFCGWNCAELVSFGDSALIKKQWIAQNMLLVQVNKYILILNKSHFEVENYFGNLLKMIACLGMS